MNTRSSDPASSEARADGSVAPEKRSRLSDTKAVMDIVESVGKVTLGLVIVIALLSPRLNLWISKDQELSASVSMVKVTQRMTLLEYQSTNRAQQEANSVTIRTNYSQADLASFGNVMYFTVAFHGLRGRRCIIRYSVRDANTGAPSVAPTALLVVTPETNNDTYTWDVRVKDPPRGGSQFVALELLDDRGSRLAVAQTLNKSM